MAEAEIDRIVDRIANRIRNSDHTRGCGVTQPPDDAISALCSRAR
jgi:hypothetical protein